MQSHSRPMPYIAALKTQWRIILALTLRETHTRFGQTKLGYFWAVFESVMHVLVFVLIFSFVGRSSPLEGDVAFFFVSGLAPFFLFRNIASRMMQTYKANRALFSFPQVTPFDTCLSRLLLEFTTSLIVLCILCIGLYLINSTIFLDNVLRFLGALICLASLGFSIGIINANILLFFPSYANLYQSTQRILYFTSGIFYIAETLPKAAQEVLWYNPLLHCVELARSALYPNFESQMVSYEYVFWWIVCSLFLSLSTQRILMAKARSA